MPVTEHAILLTEHQLQTAIERGDVGHARTTLATLRGQVLSWMAANDPSPPVEGQPTRLDRMLNNTLTQAALSGSVAMGEMVLAMSAGRPLDIDAALSWATERGHTNFVALLLAHGADPDANEGQAWAMAGRHGHQDIETLFQKKKTADILKEDLDRLTEVDLEQAIMDGDTNTAQKTIIAVLTRLIAGMLRNPIVRAEGDHNEIDLFLGNALMTAAIHDRVAVGKALLDAGVDPNIADGNAMLWAADKGHTAFVELLLERGADPSLNFNAAIGLAREHGHKDILDLFKRHAAAKAAQPAPEVEPVAKIEPAADIEGAPETGQKTGQDTGPETGPEKGPGVHPQAAEPAAVTQTNPVPDAAGPGLISGSISVSTLVQPWTSTVVPPPRRRPR